MIQAIRQRYWNAYTRLVNWGLRKRPVYVQLDSALTVCLESTISIALFTEIFVNQVYRPAFNTPNRIRQIVDLGANRGLFMLYACHLLYEQIAEQDFSILCVEPVQENFTWLSKAIYFNHLEQKVIPIRGAVHEQKSGMVDLSYYPGSHVTGKVNLQSGHRNHQVRVINLEDYLGLEEIDLLKVDIEGSEEAFLMGYPQVLQRTNVLVIEFHLDAVDIAKCKKAIEAAGLNFVQECGRLPGQTVIEVWNREKPV
jgi:FkbM family methyltransferase